MKKKQNKGKNFNVVSKETGRSWVYSDIVKDHFFSPRNFLNREPRKGEFDAEGMVGSPACGDMMKMWIKVDEKNKKISDLKWQTFGCATAIASTSIFSVMVMQNGGMKIEEALKIRPAEIVERLGGLPAIKIHCSVLADKVFKETINNYFKKHRGAVK